MAKEFNPLDRIPKSETIRKRLETVLLEASRLKILLRTAEEIESAERADTEASHA